MAKGLLHRRHRSGFRQAFHGRHLLAVSLDCEKDARAYGRSVHHHCAGTTDAVLAPDMGAGEPQPVSQKVREQQPGFDVSRYLFAVYRQVDLHAAQGCRECRWAGWGFSISRHDCHTPGVGLTGKLRAEVAHRQAAASPQARPVQARMPARPLGESPRLSVSFIQLPIRSPVSDTASGRVSLCGILWRQPEKSLLAWPVEGVCRPDLRR